MTDLLEVPAIRHGIVVDVAGLTVGLRADDDHSAEAVASLLREAPPSVRPVDVTFAVVGAAPAVPDREPDLDAAGIRQWRDDGTLHVAVGGTVARADAGSVVVGGDGGPGFGTSFRAVAVHAVAHCLAARDRLLVHGAAIRTDTGSLLVVGGSGVGKSTLAYAAVRAGCAVVSDDAVVCDAPGPDGAVRVVGLPRPLAVPADVLGTVGVPGGRPVLDDPRRRTEVPPGVRWPGSVGVDGLVVATGSDDRGPGVEPLPGPEALRAALGSTVAFADPTRRGPVFALAGALARLPAWELRRGTDPAAALADAEVALDRLTVALAHPVRG